MSSLSRILIRLRKDRGWSQERLAAISGVSERTIQRIERDGSCSLETRMALASAFGISPSDLSVAEEPHNGDVEVKTDWSGAVGLFVLGMVAPVIVLLTATNGVWEISSFSIVIGVTVVISILSHGIRDTYRLFDHTSWIVRYPTYVSGLNDHITHAKVVIENAYIVGFVASLVSGISIALYKPELTGDAVMYTVVVIKPVLYAVLFNEFWFRPYKRKMERMLKEQLSTQARR